MSILIANVIDISNIANICNVYYIFIVLGDPKKTSRARS